MGIVDLVSFSIPTLNNLLMLFWDAMVKECTLFLCFCSFRCCKRSSSFCISTPSAFDPYFASLIDNRKGPWMIYFPAKAIKAGAMTIWDWETTQVTALKMKIQADELEESNLEQYHKPQLVALTISPNALGLTWFLSARYAKTIPYSERTSCRESRFKTLLCWWAITTHKLVVCCM